LPHVAVETLTRNVQPSSTSCSRQAHCRPSMFKQDDEEPQIYVMYSSMPTSSLHIPHRCTWRRSREIRPSSGPSWNMARASMLPWAKRTLNRWLRRVPKQRELSIFPFSSERGAIWILGREGKESSIPAGLHPDRLATATMLVERGARASRSVATQWKELTLDEVLEKFADYPALWDIFVTVRLQE
jgi:hypothetical protein